MNGLEQVTKPKNDRLPEVFQSFLKECREQLEPTLFQLGFAGPEIHSHPPEIAVWYERPDLKLAVNYEDGSPLWSIVYVLSTKGWKQVAVHRLMRTIRPDLAKNFIMTQKEVRSDIHVTALKALAEFLPTLVACHGTLSSVKSPSGRSADGEEGPQ